MSFAWCRDGHVIRLVQPSGHAVRVFLRYHHPRYQSHSLPMIILRVHGSVFVDVRRVNVLNSVQSYKLGIPFSLFDDVHFIIVLLVLHPAVLGTSPAFSIQSPCRNIRTT